MTKQIKQTVSKLSYFYQIGLVQIPVILGLALMLVALPLVSKVAQQSQETRSKATVTTKCCVGNCAGQCMNTEGSCSYPYTVSCGTVSTSCDCLGVGTVCSGDTFNDTCGNRVCRGTKNCSPPTNTPAPNPTSPPACVSTGCEASYNVCAGQSYADNCGNSCGYGSKNCTSFACDTGQTQCDGLYKVRVCKSDRSGWISTDCQVGNTCSAGLCKPVPTVTPLPTNTPTPTPVCSSGSFNPTTGDCDTVPLTPTPTPTPLSINSLPAVCGGSFFAEGSLCASDLANPNNNFCDCCQYGVERLVKNALLRSCRRAPSNIPTPTLTSLLGSCANEKTGYVCKGSTSAYCESQGIGVKVWVPANEVNCGALGCNSATGLCNSHGDLADGTPCDGIGLPSCGSCANSWYSDFAAHFCGPRPTPTNLSNCDASATSCRTACIYPESEVSGSCAFTGINNLPYTGVCCTDRYVAPTPIIPTGRTCWTKGGEDTCNTCPNGSGVSNSDCTTSVTCTATEKKCYESVPSSTPTPGAQTCTGGKIWSDPLNTGTNSCNCPAGQFWTNPDGTQNYSCNSPSNPCDGWWYKLWHETECADTPSPTATPAASQTCVNNCLATGNELAQCNAQCNPNSGCTCDENAAVHICKNTYFTNTCGLQNACHGSKECGEPTLAATPTTYRTGLTATSTPVAGLPPGPKPPTPTLPVSPSGAPPAPPAPPTGGGSNTPACTYNTLQARVQINPTNELVASKTIRLGETLDITCTKNGEGTLADATKTSMKAVHSDGTTKTWANVSKVMPWTPEKVGNWTVSCSENACGKQSDTTVVTVLAADAAVSCKTCSQLSCYKNPTTNAYKWFGIGYQWAGYIQTVADTECTTRSMPKPNWQGKAMGDANCDGRVNGEDYSLWATEFRMKNAANTISSTWEADFNCSGKVDNADYLLWWTKYNQ